MKWLQKLLGLKPKPSYDELEFELHRLQNEIVECHHWLNAEFPEASIVTSYLSNMSGSNSIDNLREEMRYLKRQGLLAPNSAAVQKLLANHERFKQERQAYIDGGLSGMNKFNGYDKL